VESVKIKDRNSLAYVSIDIFAKKKRDLLIKKRMRKRTEKPDKVY
jgi:hypothetical protein